MYYDAYSLDDGEAPQQGPEQPRSSEFGTESLPALQAMLQQLEAEGAGSREVLLRAARLRTYIGQLQMRQEAAAAGQGAAGGQEASVAGEPAAGPAEGQGPAALPPERQPSGGAPGPQSSGPPQRAGSEGR